MKKVLGLAAGLALAGMVSSASATTLNLDYLSPANALRGEVTQSPTGPLTNIAVGSLNMRNASTGANFIAWCFQFANQILNNANYTVSTSALDARRRDDLSRLFTGYFDRTNTNAGAAAFQLAIWEIVEETAPTSSSGSIIYNLAAGNFQAKASSNDAVAPLANTWLASLGNFGTDYEITYLTSGNSQDILTVAPIPLPASILLLGAGLGALVVVRRRGQAAVAEA